MHEVANCISHSIATAAFHNGVLEPPCHERLGWLVSYRSIRAGRTAAAQRRIRINCRPHPVRSVIHLTCHDRITQHDEYRGISTLFARARRLNLTDDRCKTIYYVGGWDALSYKSTKNLPNNLHCHLSALHPACHASPGGSNPFFNWLISKAISLYWVSSAGFSLIQNLWMQRRLPTARLFVPRHGVQRTARVTALHWWSVDAALVGIKDRWIIKQTHHYLLHCFRFVLNKR